MFSGSVLLRMHFSHIIKYENVFYNVFLIMLICDPSVRNESHVGKIQYGSDHWITHSWSFNMTPRTWNYIDPKLSYDHFSDVNGSIFQKI